jgi:hypothetical protein
MMGVMTLTLALSIMSMALALVNKLLMDINCSDL